MLDLSFDISPLFGGGARVNAFDLICDSIVDALTLDDAGVLDYTDPKYDDPVVFCEEFFGEEYTDDVKKLMLSVRDHRATIARSANGTGKSHAAARIAIWFLLHYPGSQIYSAAAPPESNLRNILWGEIGSLLEKFKGMFVGFKPNDLKVTAKGNKKHFLTGVTIPTSGTPAKREAAFSGKHAPYLLFICDEGDGIPSEVYKGIESCMSGGLIVRLLIMFNPRHESGVVYIKERDKLANVVELSAFRHPNVVTGEHRMPGAVDRDTTLRRINEWTEVLKEGERVDPNECFEVPDFLVGCTTKSLAGVEYPPLPSGWRKIVEPAFAYMVLGRYPAAGEGQLIGRNLINAARERWDRYVQSFGYTPPRGIKPVMGLDVAELGKDQNALCLRYGGFIPEIRTWGGIDPPSTAEKAAEIYTQAGATFCAVDGTGVGAGVAEWMEREIDDYRSECYSVKMNSRPTFAIEQGDFTHMRDQLWWLAMWWLKTDPGAMLPPDEDLIEELITPTYSNENGKLKIMKKEHMKELLQRSPDKAEAFILTFYNEAIEPEETDGALAYAIRRHRGI